MSVKIMSQVWPLQMGLADKMVLLALADNANDEGQCWPSVENICAKTCLSDRAVQHSVRRLCEAGHISVTRRYKKSNVFNVHPVCPEPRSPERPSPEAPSPERNDISTPNDVHPLKNEPSKKNRKRVPREATEIDPEFQPDEKLQLFATTRLLDVDVSAVREQFLAHHQSRKTLSADWGASWRTWVMNALKFGYPKLPERKWM